MIWVGKDDKICHYEQMPREDLLRNENCTLVEAEHGGHCDFFCKNKENKGFFNYKRYSSEIIVKYFDGVSDFNKKKQCTGHKDAAYSLL